MDNNKRDNMFLSRNEIYTVVISVITVIFVAFMVYVNTSNGVFSIDRSIDRLSVITESNKHNNVSERMYESEDEEIAVSSIVDEPHSEDSVIASDKDAKSSSKLENGPVPAIKPPTSSTKTDVKAIVNINKASIEELKTLPGIGDVKATTIIEYRSTNGPFLKIDELVEVKGIGVKTLEKLYTLICV